MNQDFQAGAQIDWFGWRGEITKRLDDGLFIRWHYSQCETFYRANGRLLEDLKLIRSAWQPDEWADEFIIKL